MSVAHTNSKSKRVTPGVLVPNIENPVEFLLWESQLSDPAIPFLSAPANDIDLQLWFRAEGKLLVRGLRGLHSFVQGTDSRCRGILAWLLHSQ